MADALQALCVFLLRSSGVAFETLLVYCLPLLGGGLGGGYPVASRGVAGVGPIHSPAGYRAGGRAVVLGVGGPARGAGGAGPGARAAVVGVGAGGWGASGIRGEWGGGGAAPG